RNRLSGLFLSLFVLGFALLGLAQRADAQVLFGSVSGTVTDQSGAGVPKAHVTLINKATSVQREADADEGGHYTITDMPPGNYDLKVTASGFKPPPEPNRRAGSTRSWTGEPKWRGGR